MADTAAQDSLTWTRQRVADLQVHAAAGLSASQIAARMGMTRNQIIGKLSRIRIKRGIPAPSLPRKGVTMITFEELTPQSCRFPFGVKDYLFCGQPKVAGQSYCAAHLAVCLSSGSNLRPVGLSRSIMEAA